MVFRKNPGDLEVRDLESVELQPTGSKKRCAAPQQHAIPVDGEKSLKTAEIGVL